MKPIWLHPEARVDVKKAIAWYLGQSDSAVVGFSAELKAAFSAIHIHAKLYPAYLHGTQRIVLNRYPFSVVYRELLDSIQILAVAHAKRHPGYWKGRI